MHLSVYCSIVYNSKEATQVPINRWMDKEDVVYIYIYIYTMEYYSAIKKEWNLAFCNIWMDLEGIIAKWNKAEEDKYYMISLICWI